jgi:RimJ/RimL family protein N-acetyltransferase
VNIRRRWGGASTEPGLWVEVLELERIISFTVSENAVSRRVMQKCGFVQQGETRWRGLNHVWYALDRRYWEAPKRDSRKLTA